MLKQTTPTKDYYKQSNTTKKKRSHDIRFSPTVIIIISIVILSVLLILLEVSHITYISHSRISSLIKRGKLITCLIVGVDDITYKRSRTDTMVLAIYNPTVKRMALVSLPRDIRIEDELGYMKLNALYASRGINALRRYAEELTGLEIPYYVIINLKGFEYLVDMVGGVDVYADAHYTYHDHAANLAIDIPRGINHLDGRKALHYVRYRADGHGDIGRMERQKEIILSLFNKTMINNSFFKEKPAIKLKMLMKYVRVNFDFREIKQIFKLRHDFDYNHILLRKIPCQLSSLSSYLEINPDAVRAAIDRYVQELNQLMPDVTKDTIDIRVENGSGISGAATRVRERLVRNGFNVLEFGNAARNDYERTVVLNQSGNIEAAELVAKYLHCNDVYTKIDKTVTTDVKVIVGKNYLNLK